jgi:hypothetical protein
MPSSSAWVMIIEPTRRVDTPHDVVHACCSTPLSSRNWMPEAFAKFWPRKCEVPACSALRSCIIASMQ